MRTMITRSPSYTDLEINEYQMIENNKNGSCQKDWEELQIGIHHSLAALLVKFAFVLYWVQKQIC